MIALLKPERLDGNDVLFRAYLACDKCGRNHRDHPKMIKVGKGTSSQLRSMEKWASNTGWFTNTAHFCTECREKETGA